MVEGGYMNDSDRRAITKTIINMPANSDDDGEMQTQYGFETGNIWDGLAKTEMRVYIVSPLLEHAIAQGTL